MSTGGTPDLTIRLRYDNTQPQAVRKAESAAHKTMASDALKGAQAVEGAQKRAGQAASTAASRMVTSNRNALGQFVKMHEDAADKVRAAHEDAGRAAAESGTPFKAMAAQWVASVATVGAIKAAWSGVLSVMEAGREKTSQMARDVTAQRDALRATAAVQGKLGVDDKELMRNAQVRTYSGLNMQESAAFREQYFGSGESNKGKLAPGEYEKLENQAARFAAVKGGNAEPRARLAGRLIGMVPGAKTAEQIMAQMQSVDTILNAGEGSNDLLTSQYLMGVGKLQDATGKGGLASIGEHAALISTASKVSPESANTLVTQLVRAVRGFNKDSTTGAIAEEGQASWLKEIGVSEKDSIVQALAKVFPEMERAEKEGTPIDYFLMQHGYRDEEARSALTAQYRNREFLSQQLGTAADVPDAAKFKGDIDAAFAKDPALQKRQADAEEDLAKIVATKGGPENQEILRSRARARLVARGEYNSVFGESMNKAESVLTLGMGGTASREDREIRAMLDEQGMDGGTPITNAMTGALGAANPLLGGLGRMFPGSLSTALGLAPYETGAATGGQLPATTNVSDMVTKQEETNKLLEEQNKLLAARVGVMRVARPGGGPASFSP